MGEVWLEEAGIGPSNSEAPHNKDPGKARWLISPIIELGDALFIVCLYCSYMFVHHGMVLSREDSTKPSSGFHLDIHETFLV